MVTSHDVARLAGVSQPTVSRALRNSSRISAETRDRVHAAAKRLGYVPSHNGRVLVTRKTQRIGVVAAEIDNPFYTALLAPLHDELKTLGYRTVLINDSTREPTDFAQFADGSLDGVLLTTCRWDSELPGELARHGVPVVLLNREVYGRHHDTCVVDNVAGGVMAANLLVSLGHRRIAAIFGPEDTSTGRMRESSFRTTLLEASINLETQLVTRGEFNYSTGYEGLKKVFVNDPPTAVFCANDVIAIGALNAARAMGVGVPEDLTVIGFDDIPMASWETVDLTTVRGNIEQIARSGAHLMVERLRNPDGPLQHLTIEPTLVTRGTHRAW